MLPSLAYNPRPLKMSTFKFYKLWKNHPRYEKFLTSMYYFTPSSIHSLPSYNFHIQVLCKINPRYENLSILLPLAYNPCPLKMSTFELNLN